MSRPRLTPRPLTPAPRIRRLVPPPLFPFRRSTCSQSNKPFRKRKLELVARCQFRAASPQVMRLWAPHVAAKEAPPNDRRKQMLALHCKQSFPVISRAAEGEPGHSILGPNMPIEEEPDCDPSK